MTTDELTITINWTSIIGLFTLAQATFLTVYILIFGFKKLHIWCLAGLLLSVIIALGHDVLLYAKLAIYLPQLIGFGPFSTYLSGPLILLLVIKLLWPERQFKPLDLLHTLPFVVHFIYRWPKYTGNSQAKLEFLLNYYQRLPEQIQKPLLDLEALWQLLLFYGHRFIYIGLSLYLLYRFNHRLSHALAARKKFYLWLKLALLAYCGGWLVLKGLRYAPLTHELIQPFELVVNALALSTMIIGLGLILFRYSLDEIFSTKSLKKYQQSGMDEQLCQQVIQQLEQQLKEHQLFCDNKLSQAQLAEATGLTTQMISQALNSGLKINFNDYINQYRLEHVKQALTDSNNRTADIVQLALQSGFNSKATFYRVFKDKVGMTPSAYKKTAGQ